MITVTIHDEELQLDLSQLADKADDPAPYLSAVGAYMLASIGKNFAGEQAPTGEAWAPLAPATIAARRTGPRGGGKASHPDKILQGTGQHLRDTMNAEVNGNSVRIGPSWQFSGVHQYGGNAGKHGSAKIPARPFLGFRPEDPNNLEKMAIDYLSGGLGMNMAAGGGNPFV
jgi:phage virion morphogenesis protein